MKLKKSDLATGTFCFHPKDRDEARAIQQKLIELGFVWSGSGRTEVAHLTILDKGTLVLKNGGMSCLRERGIEGRLLDISCFDRGIGALQEPPSEPYAYLTDMFNKVFEKMEAMEKRLAQIEARLPAEQDDDATLQKPAFKTPKMR